MCWIIPLLFYKELFFNKDAFGIKYLSKIDMPLNKDIKPKPLVWAQLYDLKYSYRILNDYMVSSN